MASPSSGYPNSISGLGLSISPCTLEFPQDTRLSPFQHRRVAEEHRFAMHNPDKCRGKSEGSSAGIFKLDGERHRVGGTGRPANFLEGEMSNLGTCGMDISAKEFLVQMRRGNELQTRRKFTNTPEGFKMVVRHLQQK